MDQISFVKTKLKVRVYLLALGLLWSKIEKQEVLSYLESKSNVKDTQETMKAIDILHKQIKHICVILIEIMREKVFEFTKSTESENAKQK